MKNIFPSSSNHILAIGFIAFLLAACGDESSENITNSDQMDEYVVSSGADLPKCSYWNEGSIAYVLDVRTSFVCGDDGDWHWLKNDDSEQEKSSSSSGVRSSSSYKSVADSVLKKDPETGDTIISTDTTILSSSSYQASPEDFIDQGVIRIKDGSISGVAQKGPYLQGSTYRIIPLDGKTFKTTGDTLTDLFNNSKGSYTFSNLNLPSQYAMIEASGYYRSELTGKKSNLQMTIGAIVDVQKGANINMITNLEYERVKYLVQNEGYNIAGAKKRALTEVLSAFHIENVTGSAEQLDITKDGEANGALLAISIMIQGVAGSENVVDMMKDFREDLKDDGQWTGKTVRTKIADIAYAADSAGKFEEYRRNIADWNLSNSIPNFEKYINDFWGSEYGIGKCSKDRYGEIKTNQNENSKYVKSYFICGGNPNGDESEENFCLEKWGRPNLNTEALEACLEKISVSYFDSLWIPIGQMKANTSGQECKIGVPGNIDKDRFYTCENWTWREATDDEILIGRNTQNQACSVDGLVISGTVDKEKYFYCVVKDLGYGYSESNWRVATPLEVDKYRTECNINTQDGKLFFFSDSNYYTCDTNGIRMASFAEASIGKACIAALDGKTSTTSLNTPIKCNKGEWIYNGTYGTVSDEYGNEYKTVQIGTQTWMAENLRTSKKCPDNWRVPSNSDWEYFFKSVGYAFNSYGFSAEDDIFFSSSRQCRTVNTQCTGYNTNYYAIISENRLRTSGDYCYETELLCGGYPVRCVKD